jgi:ribosome biogenesis GTPase
MTMTTGQILKGVGGYYTVRYGGGKLCVLKARGRFRHEDKSPLPGDYVRFVPPEEGEEGAMGELVERTNLLTRPRVANVDLLCAVISAAQPAPDYLLLDKLCANAVHNGIEVCCVMNKIESAPAALCEAFMHDYRAFAPLCLSAKTGEGLEGLEPLLKEKTVCFAGQSGVGKSSLLNRLLPRHKFDTGPLTRGRRGRHTTRHAELVPTAFGGLLVDTPGFSLMDLPLMPPEDLRTLYPEFAPYEGTCRFAGCLHHAEPGCAVADAAQRGDIPPPRHARYGILLEDLLLRWRNRYE